MPVWTGLDLQSDARRCSNHVLHLRHLAARKYVALQPGNDRTERPVNHRMYDCLAAGLEQRANGVKEYIVLAVPDSLEHPNRHDPVERTSMLFGKGAVVGNLEVDLQLLFSGTLAGEFNLLCCKRYPGSFRTASGCLDGRRAPSATDIEQAGPLEPIQPFPRHVDLVALCCFEVPLRIVEKGA